MFSGHVFGKSILVLLKVFFFLALLKSLLGIIIYFFGAS